MKNTSFLCCLLAAGLFAESCGQKPAEINGSWTGTWGTAVQLTEPHNMPPAPGLSQNTIRQRFKVSIGGDSLKLRLSNEFGDTPLKIIAVSIAPALEGSKIDAQKAVRVKFSGNENIEIPVGKNVFSDAFAFKTSTRQDLAVTIAYDAVPENLRDIRARVQRPTFWKATRLTTPRLRAQPQPTTGIQLNVWILTPPKNPHLLLLSAIQLRTVEALQQTLKTVGLTSLQKDFSTIPKQKISASLIWESVATA